MAETIDSTADDLPNGNDEKSDKDIPVDENHSSESASNPITSYKDFSGIDTESFITATLQNNPKDRTFLLTLEKIFQDFIQNEEQTCHQFQAMNSYERMIVHRVAAFFGLDHNVDKNGQAIIVTKTVNTRVPNFSFQTCIPEGDLSNDGTATANPSNENSTRRFSRRNEKYSNTKPSFERVNNETRDKTFNSKTYRKQQYLNPTHHLQQLPTHIINTRGQSIYPPVSSSYYPQQSIDHDYKQQANNSSMYNYVPMMSSTSFQHGNGLSVPIAFHQQPNGQIQYVFPTHSLPQQPQLSTDGQYLPIYRSDIMPTVVQNNPYTQGPFVRFYSPQTYPHPEQSTYIQSTPSLMIPSHHPTSIQYATNQLSALSLQSQYDDPRLSQTKQFIKPFIHSSTNPLTRMTNSHQYRPIRPLNSTHTDKSITPIENDTKKTSDQISLSGQGQENN